MNTYGVRWEANLKKKCLIKVLASLVLFSSEHMQRKSLELIITSFTQLLKGFTYYSINRFDVLPSHLIVLPILY